MCLKKGRPHTLLYMLKSEVARLPNNGKTSDKTKSTPHHPIDLESINGIGAKIYEKIMQKYHDEPRAITAVRNGAIGLIEGISYKQACNISHALFQQEYGVSPQEILKSPDMEEIYHGILHIVPFHRPFHFQPNNIF